MKKYLYEDLYRVEEKHWWHLAKRRLVLRLISRYLKVSRPKILDIGCGTGKNLEALGKIGDAWGLDSSKEAVRFCHHRGLKNILHGRIGKHSFYSSSFHLVTMLDVLEHTDDKKTLREVWRILKPNGILVVTVPALPWLWSQWDVVLKHKRRYTKYSLQTILQQNNFYILKISYLYSFLVLPVFIIRLIKSLFSSKNYTSDFQLSPPGIGWVAGILVAAESFIAKVYSVPIGLSLIAVAEKR